MAPVPDLVREGRLPQPVAGVDEAGRGSWAGPVVAAAVILDPMAIPDGLDDSKKLPPARRKELMARLLDVAWTGVGCASVGEVDRLNILEATMLAMARAVDALPVAPAHALIDGNRVPKLACPATAVVRGDAACLSIAAASIIAKVTRDRVMADLSRSFPDYGWQRNAGYGTREHACALERHGTTPHHRRSFAPVARVAAST